MEYSILNRTGLLIEHAEVPRFLPPQDLAERLLAETSAALVEQRMLSTLLMYSLLREIAYWRLTCGF